MIDCLKTVRISVVIVDSFVISGLKERDYGKIVIFGCFYYWSVEKIFIICYFMKFMMVVFNLLTG